MTRLQHYDYYVIQYIKRNLPTLNIPQLYSAIDVMESNARKGKKTMFG